MQTSVQIIFNLKLVNFIILCLLSLAFFGHANASNLGRILGGAGVASRGMQEAENRVLQNRLLELQVQEANRMAIIQQLEYQRRIKEHTEAQNRELQRQQQANIEILRREQARIAEIRAEQKAGISSKEIQPVPQADVNKTKSIKNSKLSVSEKLAELVIDLRGHAPKKINNEISFIGVSSRDEKLFLMIRLDLIDVKNDSYKRVNDELQNQIGGAVVSTCLNQTFEPLTREGAVIRYSFFDIKQVFIAGVDTGMGDCIELHGLK